MQTEEFKSWHDESGEGEEIIQSCFVIEIWELASHLSGNKSDPLGDKKESQC